MMVGKKVDWKIEMKAAVLVEYLVVMTVESKVGKSVDSKVEKKSLERVEWLVVEMVMMLVD